MSRFLKKALRLKVINAMRNNNRYPAEFESQSYIQMIFPHAQSDWAPYLDEASATFVAIIEAVARFEPCVVVCDDIERVKAHFNNTQNLHFVTFLTNDTWARDCSCVTVIEEGRGKLLDFTFTGWGGKFDASRDNALSRHMAAYNTLPTESFKFILEGGGIESNGKGVLLTTSECLLNPNRNAAMGKSEVEAFLQKNLHVSEILWLDHGYLAGDDTDSHIDTLARFISEDTIMYVKCDDTNDEHYEALKAMERQLQGFMQSDGTPYRLVALPMTDAIYYDDERLPATYANFLILNNAVLLPVYNDPHDAEAIATCKAAFAGREIVPIDCSVLIRQHGSLHCVTMHFPEMAQLSRENPL